MKPLTKEDSIPFEPSALQKVNVAISQVTLQCTVCWQRWSVSKDAEGELPVDYWKCPYSHEEAELPE